MKVAILGASFDTGNMGVSVLAAGATGRVKEQYPDAEVYLFEYARTTPPDRDVRYPGGTVRVRTVNPRFSKWIYQPNNILFLIVVACLARLCPVASGRNWILGRNRILAELASTDLFLAVSGGDSFSDIYGFVRLAYVSLPQILVLLCGKQLVLLPQTYGPFKKGISRSLARIVLRHASRVFSRDRVGIDYVAKLAGYSEEEKKKLRFCYDLGFHVPVQKPDVIDIKGLDPSVLDQPGLVGVNISGLLLNGGQRFGFSMSYRTLMEKVLEYLLGECGATVLLVPHVLGQGEDSDTTACHQAYESFAQRYPGRIGVVNRFYCYDETKYLIGRCEFFVGARMHACIGALSQAVPAAAIAYSDKFKGVMQSIECDGITVDLRSGTEVDALAQVAGLYGRRKDIHAGLAEMMPKVRAVLGRILAGL